MNRVPIKNYEGLYEITDDGRVYNIKRDKYLVNVLEGRYMIVLLYKKNKRRRYYVHRLVAEAFCEKGEGKIYVNHKDFDRCNNNSYNLEWVTPRENVIHYISSDRYKPRKLTEEHIIKIKEYNHKKVLCLKTNVVFESMGHFAAYKKISLAQVSQKLNNVYFNNLDAILI